MQQQTPSQHKWPTPLISVCYCWLLVVFLYVLEWPAPRDTLICSDAISWARGALWLIAGRPLQMATIVSQRGNSLWIVFSPPSRTGACGHFSTVTVRPLKFVTGTYVRRLMQLICLEAVKNDPRVSLKWSFCHVTGTSCVLGLNRNPLLILKNSNQIKYPITTEIKVLCKWYERTRESKFIAWITLD